MILPIIVITTQEALRAVPQSLRQAALALGATRWQVVRDHVLPSALPGILTGTILGLSRAIGETAPLLMVGAAGSILRLPKGPLDRYSALPVEIYNYAKEPDPKFQTVAAGGILILVVALALDERRRHRDPQPLPALSLTSRRNREPPIHCETIDERLRDSCRPQRRRIRPTAAPAPRAPAGRVPSIRSSSPPAASRSGTGRRLALKDITIDIPRNKITALIGPRAAARARCSAASTG